VRRNPRRTEAEIQADVRQFILSAPFELESGDLVDVSLESPVGDRKRIDVEAGSTVIEVKRDLRRERVRSEAEEQLAGYVEFRVRETGLRYAGVLTDGTEWRCYNLVDGQLKQVDEILLEDIPADVTRLIVWLEGVLATTRDIAPTAQNIEQRLGAGSSAYKLDRSTLAAIYEKHRNDPTVVVKRKLWTQLLLSALGTQFKDDDDLFIDHTLLVNTSEIIAHEVLGLDVRSLSAERLLAGDEFAEAGVYGVVEPDFFDWVIEVDEGEAFIRTLAKRLMRFVWSEVDQDVLKILYENFIGTETRKRLGEYYTPDWLAEIIVAEGVVDPLHTKVLDPACGSGTFLFYAVRRYMDAALASGSDVASALTNVTRYVVGMDLHPVAVTLARVTYLLALGRERLTDPTRGNIQIPVYLGDSIQWREQSVDLWSAGNLVIRTEEHRNLFGSDLTFPDPLLDDTATFDQLVNELADRASRRKPGSPIPPLNAVFARLSVPEKFQSTIATTFHTMCQLHDQGRDHIWGYYVRNLARPLWLSKPGNQVDMIVGNPPWLAYSHMTPEMQDTFRAMSERRGLWGGAQLAPRHDLAALFVIRVCELYLRKGGHFALVLPNAALDRDTYEGFRTGRYTDELGTLTLSFDPAWDLRRLRPHFFPRACCVAFGSRTEPECGQSPMPTRVQIWKGKLEASSATWIAVNDSITRSDGELKNASATNRSPYHACFTQGATILPLLVFFVRERKASALGIARGKIAVQSYRSVNEKKPWKNLPALTGVVERRFIKPVYSGESVLPFRVATPMSAVLPCTNMGLLRLDEIELHPGLQQWWNQASELWEKHRSSERLSLADQLDFHSKLSVQLPIAPLRVVYNRSGMHICAAKLKDTSAVVTSGLYWHAVDTESEADYVCAILNAPNTTELTRPLMSYSKDERDIAKHVWELPIPTFDGANGVHQRIAKLGSDMEKLAAEFEVDEKLHFAATRRHIRDVLNATAAGQELNDLTFDLLQ
jgi:Type I restriction-modification system methyltransferase subunit